MPALYAPPVKRSITIAGHETALTLEPVFWHALRAAAAEAKLPLNALVARIDAERIMAPEPPNLASAIRCWLYQNLLANVSQER
jgi:predicted DNA-binding ribbon-helix-helix protein